MKIALIHHKLGPGGGMEVFFNAIAEECARQGHEVDVYVAEKDPSFSLPDTIPVQVMPVSKWIPKSWRKFVFAQRLKRLLQTKHYDCRISTTRSFSQDIVIPGGTHKAYLQQRKIWRLKDLIETHFEERAYKTSRFVIAQSPTMRQELQNLYGLAADKIKVMYPPVDAQHLSFKTHSAHQPLRLLFISSSHKRKGGLLLLEALRSLPADAFELWVIGRPFPQTQSLKQKVRELGYIKDLTPFYHDADLLVLPSYFEPFGLVGVEALQSGLPILVSRVCGVTPLLHQDEALILEQQNANDLANLLLEAKEKTFNIEPNFIKCHQLDLADYVKQLLALS